MKPTSTTTFTTTIETKGYKSHRVVTRMEKNQAILTSLRTWSDASTLVGSSSSYSLTEESRRGTRVNSLGGSTIAMSSSLKSDSIRVHNHALEGKDATKAVERTSANLSHDQTHETHKGENQVKKKTDKHGVDDGGDGVWVVGYGDMGDLLCLEMML